MNYWFALITPFFLWCSQGSAFIVPHSRPSLVPPQTLTTATALHSTFTTTNSTPLPQALQDASLDELNQLLEELEALNQACTEEGNQTNEECDVEAKAEREALMEQVEYQIAKARTDIRQVKACLASPEPCGVDQMTRMLQDLERVNNECTEEGNQTNDECDVELKAEREALMEELSYQIAKSSTDVDQVKACLASPEPCGVDQMARMLQDLERVNNKCTEEGNQTNEECDVEVKAERENLMQELEYQIAKQTADVPKQTDAPQRDVLDEIKAAFI